MRRHLIALDGKEHSDYALEWYLENVNRSEDEVILFHCSQFILSVGLPGAAANVNDASQKVREALKKAEEIVHTAREKLMSKGVKAQVRIKSGMKAHEAILRAIEEEKVNHVIIGRRDLGTVQRAFLGSVSSTVLANAKVPVTIVKRPH